MGAGKDFGRRANSEKSVCVWEQNTGQNYNIKRANKSFENVTRLRYLEATLINQTYLLNEIRCR